MTDERSNPPYTSSIEAIAGSRRAVVTHDFVVRAKHFPTRTLKVDPAFVTPPTEMEARIVREAAELEALWHQSARTAGRDARPSPTPGVSRTGVARGRGIAAVAYEGDNGYVAMVAELSVDRATGTHGGLSLSNARRHQLFDYRCRAFDTTPSVFWRACDRLCFALRVAARIGSMTTGFETTCS